MNENFVSIWEESICIPTYSIGKPEKNPDFLNRSIHPKGGSYPNPAIEKILDSKKDEFYQAVFLENSYLTLMILPELGGRIQMMYDKVNARHLVSCHDVIKPVWTENAGIQLAGGLTFSWSMQGHSHTFESADYLLEEHPNGCKTAWIHFLEGSSPIKNVIGFRLYPDKFYLEINTRLCNRTPFPQAFLWQSQTVLPIENTYCPVFPPEIHVVLGHGQQNISDSSWLPSGEEQGITQYFMPYKNLTTIKNATRDAMVGLEIKERKAIICLQATALYRRAVIKLWYEDKLLWKETTYIAPEKPFQKELMVPYAYAPERYRVSMEASNGKVLVSCLGVETQPDSEVTKTISSPYNIRSIEQLFLTGLYVEQYPNTTYTATDYYQEALRREPGDVRNNNAMGLWYLRRGKYAWAEPYFVASIQTLTELYPNFCEGELYYYFGWTLWMENRLDEAFEAFYKSSRHSSCQAISFLNLARIATSRAEYDEALYLIDQSLLRYSHNHTARHLKASILRKCLRLEEALFFIQDSLILEPFNYGCMFEKWLIYTQQQQYTAADTAFNHMQQMIRGRASTYISYVSDYIYAGLYPEAMEFLQAAIGTGEQSCLLCYYMAFCAEKAGKIAKTANYTDRARTILPDFCFPNRLEDVWVLQAAIQRNPDDARALYYLGNFWYANQQYAEAFECWEQSVYLDDTFPTVYRNLALAYSHQQHNSVKALIFLEKAFALDTSDAHILMELDQMYRKLNMPLSYRLALLEEYLPLTENRDELYLERIVLYNQLGEYHKVKELLTTRRFYTAQGSEKKVMAQYRICHLELAKLALLEGKAIEAIDLLEQIQNYQYGFYSHGNIPENDILYLKGCAYQLLDTSYQAEAYFQTAATYIPDGMDVYVQPEQFFYQGLAWRVLNVPEKATAIFQQLIHAGRMGLNDVSPIPEAMVCSGEKHVFDKDLVIKKRVHWYYMMALGYMGLGTNHTIKAEKYLTKILELDNSHQGAAIHFQPHHAQIPQ